MGGELRGGFLGTGTGRGGAALGGGLLLALRLGGSRLGGSRLGGSRPCASLSGRIESVRTRLESLPLLPDGWANAFEPPLFDPPDEDVGNPEPGNAREPEGVLISSGSSSRGTTRSALSRTRSCIDF